MFFQFPELSDFVIYTYVFYFFLGLVVYKTESSGVFNLPYSKFSTNKGLNPKLGMFIIYFIPIFFYLGIWIQSKKLPTFYNSTLLFCILVHFGKRCLEVVFLHKFSGKISFLSITIITFAYSNIAILLGNLHQFSYHELEFSNFRISFGIILFILGQIGNFIHHKILYDLRQNTNEKKYFIPEKGMFKILICPHYFFELISWFSIAFISSFVDTYFIFYIMTFYLMGRSYRTKEWYLEKFPNFPRNKKRVIPFLY